MSLKSTNSCGALFYTISPTGVIGVILGDESRKGTPEWLPFKGCVENNETYEETAKREIKEESGGLIVVDNIKLEHIFSTKRKTYHIGLVKVPYCIIEKYNSRRHLETRNEYTEKKELKFFPIDEVLLDYTVHSISRASIKYYWQRIQAARTTDKEPELLRDHAISNNLAKVLKDRVKQITKPLNKQHKHTAKQTNSQIDRQTNSQIDRHPDIPYSKLTNTVENTPVSNTLKHTIKHTHDIPNKKLNTTVYKIPQRAHTSKSRYFPVRRSKSDVNMMWRKTET